jgi:hypothetical protein
MRRVKATQADASACNPLHVELSEEVDETTVAPPQHVCRQTPSLLLVHDVTPGAGVTAVLDERQLGIRRTQNVIAFQVNERRQRVWRGVQVFQDVTRAGLV